MSALRQGDQVRSPRGFQWQVEGNAAVACRSTVAYPLCCQPRDNPRIWCMKFLAFGISK